MAHPARLLLVCLATLAASSPARADTRRVIRVGVAPIELATTDETPVLGGRMDDVVGAYNTAADAYNQAHGYAPGSAMATDAIAVDDLGVRATLLTVAPALEVGGERAYVRIEAVLGLGEDLRAYGLGFYPLNLAARLRRGGAIVAYVSAGGSASWLDRPSTDDELGALITARAALGLRFGQRVTLEVGYAAYVLGGLVDRARIRTMTDYDPSGSAPPPSPVEAIAGGEQRGLIDASLGVAF